MSRPDRHGFTLIELAVVLIIIGILVGGVLRGQDLIDSARANRLVGQSVEIRTAVATFQLRYDALPGDMRAGDVEVLSPVASAIGDGDGRLEGDRVSPDSVGEATAFWQHLALTGLLTGYTPDEDGYLGPEDGLTTPFGGFWTARTETRNGVTGLWLLAGTETPSAANINAGPILSAAFARVLDARGDDGRPSGGTIQSFGNAADAPGATGGDLSCVAGGAWNPAATDARACVLALRL